MKRTMKSESGRSMVEILGVLAIIGVLSIGGIAGYTMAMNRFRTNEAIDIANKMASLAFAQNQTLLARTGKGYNKSDASTATAGTTAVPSVRALGLVTTSGTSNQYNGADLEVTKIDNDGVTIKMTFPSKAVCDAGYNILGATGTACTTNVEYTHEFRQS